MAITWRDVAGANFGSANQLASTSTNTIDRGLGQLTRLSQGFADEQAANWNNQKKNNTDAVMAQLNGIGDLGALEAAKQNGTFDLTKYGAQIDANAVRSAVDGRDNQIMSDINTTTQFANQQQAEADKPFMAQFETQGLNVGNQKDVNAILEQAKGKVSEQGLLDLSKSLKSNLSSNIENKFKQNERLRAENERAVETEYGKTINSLLVQGGSESDNIATLNKYADEKGLNSSQRSKMFNDHKATYEALNSLTSEEKATVNKFNQDALQIQNQEISKAEAEYANAIKDTPSTNPIKSWDDSFKKGDAVKALIAKTPIDQINQSNAVVGWLGLDPKWFSGEDAATELTRLMDTKYKKVDPNIIGEAVNRTVAEGGAIHFPTLEKNIDAAIVDYEDFKIGDIVRQKAQSKFNATKTDAEKAYNDFSSGILKTIQDTKKLKNSAKTKS